jgi:hypothetical protein
MLLVRHHHHTKQEVSPPAVVSEQSRPYMCANVTFTQIKHLDENWNSDQERMAIIFSLPWALLVWSYVVSCPSTLILPICTGLLLLPQVPQQDGNIFYRIVELLFRHFEPLEMNNCRPDVGHRGPHLAVLRTTWGSRNAWKVWLDGFIPSFVRVLPYDRTSRGLDGAGNG